MNMWFEMAYIDPVTQRKSAWKKIILESKHEQHYNIITSHLGQPESFYPRLPSSCHSESETELKTANYTDYITLHSLRLCFKQVI